MVFKENTAYLSITFINVKKIIATKLRKILITYKIKTAEKGIKTVCCCFIFDKKSNEKSVLVMLSNILIYSNYFILGELQTTQKEFVEIAEDLLVIPND